MMKTGDRLPDLLGSDSEGREVRLSEFPGRRIALCFYPKDNTPGCTAEACSLRDNYEALRDAGFEVIGVSVDPAESHRKFIARNNLPYTLVADTDRKLVEAAGVWGEKSMAGRKYMGTFRTTMIVTPEGVIEHIIGPKQIKTKIHGEQLLQLAAES